MLVFVRILLFESCSPSTYLSVTFTGTRSDFVVRTDFSGFAQARSQICRVLESIIAAHPRRWAAWQARDRPGGGRGGDVARANDLVPSTSTTSLAEAYDAVIFDLDDTLVPVMAPLLEAFRVLQEELERRGLRGTLKRLPELRDIMADMTKVSTPTHKARS